MSSGVYIITNTANGNTYIGSASGKRGISGRLAHHKWALTNNRHENPKLQHAWNKYGADAFIFEVLLYCNPENCLMYEQIALDYYKSKYNIALFAAAPMSGRKHSKQSRIKMSISKKGIPKPSCSDATREKRRKNQTGKRLSDVTKKKMSKQRQGSKHPMSKLTESDIPVILKLLADGHT